MQAASNAACLMGMDGVQVQVQGSPPGYDINYVLFGLDGKQAADLMHGGKIWDR